MTIAKLLAGWFVLALILGPLFCRAFFVGTKDDDPDANRR